MLNPRKTNIALDANALDRTGGQRDALVERFRSLLTSRTLNVVMAHGVRVEVQRPRTPADLQDAMLPQTFNLLSGLNTEQQEARRRVAVILQGNAQSGKHAADASHVSEAAETQCAYFITEDARILRKRDELSGVFPHLSKS